MKHFLDLTDVSTDQLMHVLDVGFALREQRRKGQVNEPVLSGRTLSLLFEKPSLRTRASFEQAAIELGGHAMVLGAGEVGLGKRESVGDVARVLSGMVHAIAARVFEHQTLVELANSSTVPIINALSDQSHPCQALADVMTIIDAFGRDLRGKTLAFIGDGNNVARSLARVCAKLEMNFAIASPPGFELTGVECVNQVTNPAVAVTRADVVYTDTWVSMGQEAEQARRETAFGPYQVNGELMAHAPAGAIVLHCLPAYRGVEVTDEVLDSPASRAFDQAHNRLHAQKGLLAVLMARR